MVYQKKLADLLSALDDWGTIPIGIGKFGLQKTPSGKLYLVYAKNDFKKDGSTYKPIVISSSLVAMDMAEGFSTEKVINLLSDLDKLNGSLPATLSEDTEVFAL